MVVPLSLTGVVSELFADESTVYTGTPPQFSIQAQPSLSTDYFPKRKISF
jgi:hypothetical protein